MVKTLLPCTSSCLQVAHAADMLASQIEVRITCTCSVWGMQTTVEGMMVAQAEESMLKFLAWAKTQCIMFKQVW